MAERITKLQLIYANHKMIIVIINKISHFHTFLKVVLFKEEIYTKTC